MKKYGVWIYDEESDCNQPVICKARNEAEARRIGRKYIANWGLIGGTITEVKEME